MDLRIGFLASGNGSNVEAILENIEKGKLKADPKLIISNNPDAGVFEVALKYGIPSYHIKHKKDNSHDGIIINHGCL